METARGRSFLREYALRTRTTDTASLLTAIGRIESLLITRSLEPAELARDDMSTTSLEAKDAAGFDAPRDHAAASAIAFLGPQVIAASLPAEPAQPTDPIEPAPREPFADICALSNHEKIALFT